MANYLLFKPATLERFGSREHPYRVCQPLKITRGYESELNEQKDSFIAESLAQAKQANADLMQIRQTNSFQFFYMSLSILKAIFYIHFPKALILNGIFEKWTQTLSQYLTSSLEGSVLEQTVSEGVEGLKALKRNLLKTFSTSPVEAGKVKANELRTPALKFCGSAPPSRPSLEQIASAFKSFYQSLSSKDNWQKRIQNTTDFNQSVLRSLQQLEPGHLSEKEHGQIEELLTLNRKLNDALGGLPEKASHFSDLPQVKQVKLLSLLHEALSSDQKDIQQWGLALGRSLGISEATLNKNLQEINTLKSSHRRQTP